MYMTTDAGLQVSSYLCTFGRVLALPAEQVSMEGSLRAQPESTATVCSALVGHASEKPTVLGNYSERVAQHLNTFTLSIPELMQCAYQHEVIIIHSDRPIQRWAIHTPYQLVMNDSLPGL